LVKEARWSGSKAPSVVDLNTLDPNVARWTREVLYSNLVSGDWVVIYASEPKSIQEMIAMSFHHYLNSRGSGPTKKSCKHRLALRM
jgi:hypothetical protein